MFLAKFKH